MRSVSVGEHFFPILLRVFGCDVLTQGRREIMGQEYFLRTSLNTYVFRRGEERLIHLSTRRRAMNLPVEFDLARNDRSSLVGYFRMRENAAPAPVVTELRPGGKVALMTAGGYLSASPNGEFALQDRLETCEIFTPMSAEEVLQETRSAAFKVKRLTSSSIIPKTIHQIYFGDFPLPDAIQKNIEELKK